MMWPWVSRRRLEAAEARAAHLEDLCMEMRGRARSVQRNIEQAGFMLAAQTETDPGLPLAGPYEGQPDHRVKSRG